MLVIVSEDGMIDIVPKLKPLISKREIQCKLDEFEMLSNEESPNYKKYNDFMSYFRQVSFYLLGEECTFVNEHRKKIESKFDDNNIRIIYEDLTPNREMNESFYVEHN